jgi:ribosomal protein S18 acetylase RimI-like enzyme
MLTVALSNAPAVLLYAGEGFVQQEVHLAYFGSGEDRVVMRRDARVVFPKS